MFSTDFIYRQQENLVDNQKCQAGFRPLCNKILFLHLNRIYRAKRFYIFWTRFVFSFIVAAPNAFEVSEGALPILLFFLDVCSSVFDFSCNLSLVPSTELLWFSLIIFEIIWKVWKNIRIKKCFKSDYLSAVSSYSVPSKQLQT